MSINYLIHKNIYSKTHSSFTYGLIKTSSGCHITNLHNRLYDLYFSLQPKNIVCQLEEYSNELHGFAMDTSLKTNLPRILVTVDNNDIAQDKYVNVLRQIQGAKITLVIPHKLADYIKSIGLKFDAIAYENLYNNDVFFPMEMERNNKILCILSTDKKCLSKIEPLLYPNTSVSMVLVNNPEINVDQNIGLMFDSDMNLALNTYGAVIDLSNSYKAEIAVCGIKKYDADKLPELVENTEKIDPIEMSTFIKTNISGDANEQ